MSAEALPQCALYTCIRYNESGVYAAKIGIMQHELLVLCVCVFPYLSLRHWIDDDAAVDVQNAIAILATQFNAYMIFVVIVGEFGLIFVHENWKLIHSVSPQSVEYQLCPWYLSIWTIGDASWKYALQHSSIEK